ncbi:hypothetical protein Q31b_09020 [Novipirellula aureliae]|uniref:Uncharacterized protein n=1 Tax=Novipirellula aureliae TaxID=2527966 RepID=A0A5C6EDR6_9BACT|nr:hypothetical protein [Novipirellula aureliae]TWU45726.1 hypothetical protein Q31b_09020 [Novipirellula aureliae]
MNDPANASPSGNPYVQARMAGSPDTAVVRPTGVTVISVLAILAGVVGLFGSLMIGIQLLVGDKLMTMMNQGGPFEEAQAEMQQDINAVMARFLIPSVLIGVTGLLLAVLYLSGGVGLILRKRWSRVLMRRTLLFAIVFECLRNAVYGLMQLQIAPINEAYMRKLAEKQGGGEMVAQFTSIAAVVGIVFFLAWALVKVGLITWAYRYLRKPIVVEYIDG